jgi:hypothetical protein
MSLVEEEVNPLEEFSPEVQADVDGLIHLGHLSDEVEFCGHTFGLRTLRLGEELSAAKVSEPFSNTLKAAESWASAQVALALTSVDDDEDFCPQAGPNQDVYARARFQYLSKNWYWPTVDFLYSSLVRLQQRQLAAIRALQDLSARNRLTFSPSADSLRELGIFSDEIDSEIPPSQS